MLTSLKLFKTETIGGLATTPCRIRTHRRARPDGLRARLPGWGYRAYFQSDWTRRTEAECQKTGSSRKVHSARLRVERPSRTGANRSVGYDLPALRGLGLGVRGSSGPALGSLTCVRLAEPGARTVRNVIPHLPITHHLASPACYRLFCIFGLCGRIIVMVIPNLFNRRGAAGFMTSPASATTMDGKPTGRNAAKYGPPKNNIPSSKPPAKMKQPPAQ